MSEFAGYTIELPFGPAAGVLNGANEAVLVSQTQDVLRSPAGAVWMGSFTHAGGIGNEPLYGRCYYHDPTTGQTVNSMGLPNIGIERAVVIYPELKKLADGGNKPLIPSVSPGKGEDPTVVLPEMAERFADAGATIVEVNYSCPNKIDASGGREPVLGFDIAQMEAVDQAVVAAVGNDVMIIRKLPPYITERSHLLNDAITVFERATGSVALSLSNTIGGQTLFDAQGRPALSVPGNSGGMSGPYARDVGEEQLHSFRLALPDVPAVSCLGIVSGEQVYGRVHRLGATLTSGVTVFLENETRRGMSYGQTAQRIAEEYVELQNFWGS